MQNTNEKKRIGGNSRCLTSCKTYAHCECKHMLTLGIKLKKPHLVHILESFCPINRKQEFCQEDFTKFAAFMLESSMHQLVNLKKKSFSNVLLPYPTSSNSTKKESERIIRINFKPLSCSNFKGLCTAFSTKKKTWEKPHFWSILGPFLFNIFKTRFSPPTPKNNFISPLYCMLL